MGRGILTNGREVKSGLQHPGLFTMMMERAMGSYSVRIPRGDLTNTSFMSRGSIPWLRYSSGSVVGTGRWEISKRMRPIDNTTALPIMTNRPV